MIRSIYSIVLFTILTTNSLYSQSYSEVDNKVKSYSKSYSNLEKLANQINSDFKEKEAASSRKIDP